MYAWQNLRPRGTAFQLCILDCLVPALNVHQFPLKWMFKNVGSVKAYLQWC